MNFRYTEEIDICQKLWYLNIRQIRRGKKAFLCWSQSSRFDLEKQTVLNDLISRIKLLVGHQTTIGINDGNEYVERMDIHW